MALNQRKLEVTLKEVNADFVKEGILTERVTQDIWTKLMSNLTQGEYSMAIPIRKELQLHVRKKRQNKMYTFNKIIQRLDELLDSYIPPPVLHDNKNDKWMKAGKQKLMKTRESAEAISITDVKEEGKSDLSLNRHIFSETSNTQETNEKISEPKKKEAEFTREEYYCMQANQSVLKKTIDDQQMKIKILEQSVRQLEKSNMTLAQEIENTVVEKEVKIDLYSKAEREIKFLRNELTIKERSLQLSLIERNELLDRLSSAVQNQLNNKSSSKANFDVITRPTQLADMYSKLIDSEWSDALHLLRLKMKDEKSVIQCLLEILMDSYWFCVSANESHTNLLIDSLLNPFSCSSDVKIADSYRIDDVRLKLLTDLKRSAAVNVLSKVQVQFQHTMERTKKKLYEEITSRKLMAYIDKCVELCWYMVNQGPPIVFDHKSQKPGDDFNRDAYKFHTKFGSKVDFLVLPAMYIKGGYLLLQGVAQPKQEDIALRIASSMSKRHTKFESC